MIENRLYILNKFWEIYESNGIKDAMTFLNDNNYYDNESFNDINNLTLQLEHLKT